MLRETDIERVKDREKESARARDIILRDVIGARGFEVVLVDELHFLWFMFIPRDRFSCPMPFGSSCSSACFSYHVFLSLLGLFQKSNFYCV